MRIARPLANREFRWLWSGQAVSQLGDGIFTVALAWQTLQQSRSATTLSLVLFARTLPLIGFALVGGAVTDRLPRRRVMIASDLVRGLCVAAIASLASAGRLEVAPDRARCRVRRGRGVLHAVDLRHLPRRRSDRAPASGERASVHVDHARREPPRTGVGRDRDRHRRNRPRLLGGRGEL